MEDASQSSPAQAFAEVARALQAEATAQRTLEKVVALAVDTIPGCDHAGVSLVTGREVTTPAATDEVPMRVDELQYETGQGPCLDAITHREVFLTDDLTRERRWPRFSDRAAAETGVRSMLSFRLFLERDTLGALNLYSRQVAAFDADSRATGAVFAAHAAVALAAAREHDRAQRLQQDLTNSEEDMTAYQARAQIATALQRSMLPSLPNLSPVELAARYVPATTAAEIGGDWYDAFALPDGVTALVIGDVAGHDVQAAARMGQLRNLLRGLAVDRGEAPGDLLGHLDRVAAHLQVADLATCIYGLLEPATPSGWQFRFANAGHPPPLLVTAGGDATYLETTRHMVLGTGMNVERTPLTVDVPPGATLLLYTDGLVEHRGRTLDHGMSQLRELAATIATRPVDEICHQLTTRLAASPADDVCLLALRTPRSTD